MKFAVIGHPIDHSLSPVMHHANFQALNLDYGYEALNVPPKDMHLIKEIITSKGLDGFNVTIPHKTEIMSYLDVIDEASCAIGAVNTVKIENGKWIGYNTDGIGYVKGLIELDLHLKHRKILILGAGGASKGIAHALDKITEHKVTVANRTLSRFDSWQLDVHTMSLNEAASELDQFDIVINTTPLGMKDNQELPIELTNLKRGALVSDIVYTPSETPFLKAAKAQGNPIYNGLDMFVQQGAESFKIWTGHTADIEAMKNKVIEYL
ncbi:shikimate dehydrogenase [Staphylococcus massiliensis]|uniref:shikimate dehydrogenase n=1 Tax=Staphylococcus massiliensis TaxID=555791 RepID=UPI001EDED8D8|nr:shikimate dehydrogenase [Staphylococcus massiliensis]MCG3399039.1 shikimate dehydrogenase [Staphylococcus massiliensis]MCG3400963.1 shikimate dehydrogenase [Staphylococcus massiliensis]MCG3412499.1 shikimate dehydrogenase [Staphylococcus massiliensis]